MWRRYPKCQTIPILYRSGTGILLAVTIIYQYFEIFVREQVGHQQITIIRNGDLNMFGNNIFPPSEWNGQHGCTALLNLLPLCPCAQHWVEDFKSYWHNIWTLTRYLFTLRPSELCKYSERSSEHECRLQKIQFRPETKLASTSFGIKQLLY